MCRCASILALLAIVTLLVRPALCDLLHELNDHDGDTHHADNETDSPELAELEHCCGGHDPAPDTCLNHPVSASDTLAGCQAESFVTRAILPPADHPATVSHSLIDMPAYPTAQGNPCALLCKFVI